MSTHKFIRAGLTKYYAIRYMNPIRKINRISITGAALFIWQKRAGPVNYLANFAALQPLFLFFIDQIHSYLFSDSRRLLKLH